MADLRVVDQAPDAAPALGPLLEVIGLEMHLSTRSGLIKPVNGVSFSLRPASVLGIVGESGAGKTLTAMSMLSVVPRPGKIVNGQVLYRGRDLLQMRDKELQKIRGREIAIVSQDATESLNPVLTVGSQIEEMLTTHLRLSKREARPYALEALRRVGIPDAEETLGRYAFQLSGGMRQRVLLAMAMVLNPRILIADEPTSGQDLTFRAEVLDQLRRLKEERGTAIILISHDLGVIAQMADDVLVMYAGYAVERGPAKEVLHRPLHPYTWGLLRALPKEEAGRGVWLALPGNPPDMVDMPPECPFIARCNKARNVCRSSPMPPLVEQEPGHFVACYNPVRHD